MPILTDLNKNPIALVVVGLLWILLLTRTGSNGRVAALLLIPTIILSDQFNSSFLKFVLERPRPCAALPHVHLLVSCGSGFSFPSSHAVNNFAGAIVLAYFQPKWWWSFTAFAVTISFSRIYVGVHYPADVVAGALVGLACGGIVIAAYQQLRLLWVKRRRVGSSSK